MQLKANNRQNEIRDKLEINLIKAVLKTLNTATPKDQDRKGSKVIRRLLRKIFLKEETQDMTTAGKAVFFIPKIISNKKLSLFLTSEHTKILQKILKTHRRVQMKR